jgi:hypothetical protein
VRRRPSQVHGGLARLVVLFPARGRGIIWWVRTPRHAPPPCAAVRRPRLLWALGLFLLVRVPFALYGYQCKVTSLPQANFLGEAEPRAARPGDEGRPYGAGCPATRQSFTWFNWRVPGILKTPCAAHRIDQPSPNFGRSAERPSLTGAIILVCPAALTFPCKPVTCILLLRRGNAPFPTVGVWARLMAVSYALASMGSKGPADWRSERIAGSEPRWPVERP